MASKSNTHTHIHTHRRASTRCPVPCPLFSVPGTTPARIGAHPWFHISTHKCAYNVCTLPSSLSATSASSGPARENNNKCSYNKEEKEKEQCRAGQGRRRSLAPAGASVMQSTCKCFYMFVVSTLGSLRLASYCGEGGTEVAMNWMRQENYVHTLNWRWFCSVRLSCTHTHVLRGTRSPRSSDHFSPFPDHSPALVNLIYARFRPPRTAPHLMHNLPHLAKTTSTKAMAMPSHRSHRRSAAPLPAPLAPTRHHRSGVLWRHFSCPDVIEGINYAHDEQRSQISLLSHFPGPFNLCVNRNYF